MYVLRLIYKGIFAEKISKLVKYAYSIRLRLTLLVICTGERLA